MALNPPLDSNGNPCRVNGEYFILNRTGVEFEFKVSGGNKYTGKGKVNKNFKKIIFYIVNTHISSCYLSQRKK